MTDLEEKSREIDLKAEAAFEDAKAVGETPRGAQAKFYRAVLPRILEHKRHTCDAIADKDVLEIGCASGGNAALYCKTAKSYVGVDISEQAIKNCEALELGNGSFLCVDGHTIELPESQFDFVIVNGLLHHMDLPTAFREIIRLCKPSGKLIFCEPLGINPVFQLYRVTSPGARTEDERPFTSSDLRLMRKYFQFEEVTWYGFLALASAFISSKRLNSILLKMDAIIARTPIRFWFWTFAGVASLKCKKD